MSTNNIASTPDAAADFADRIAAELARTRGRGSASGASADRSAAPTHERAQTAAGSRAPARDDGFYDDPADDDDEPVESPRTEPERAAPLAETVGEGQYLVRQGECVASIALEQGFFWKTLWNRAENGDLRATRIDPHVLLPGDRVFIPEKRRKDEPGATEARHRFVRRGEPSLLRLTFLDYERQPRAGAAYRLVVDGVPFSGNLDDSGTLSVRVPGNARRATAEIGQPPLVDRYALRLGALDPVATPTGAAARLINLAYMHAGEMDPAAPPAPAIAEFQASSELPPTGRLDEASRAKLADEHRSD